MRDGTTDRDGLMQMVGDDVEVHTTARPAAWCGRLRWVDKEQQTITVYIEGETQVFPLANIEVVVRRGAPHRAA